MKNIRYVLFLSVLACLFTLGNSCGSAEKETGYTTCSDAKKKEDARLAEEKKQAAIRKKRIQDSINSITEALDLPVIYKDQIKYRLILDFDKTNPYFITKDNDFIKIIDKKNNYKLVGTYIKNGVTTAIIKDLNGKVVFEIVGKELYMSTQRVGDLIDYK